MTNPTKRGPKPRAINSMNKMRYTMKVRLRYPPAKLKVGGHELEQFTVELDQDPFLDYACAVCGAEEIWQGPLPWYGFFGGGCYHPICEECRESAMTRGGTGPLLPVTI